MQRIIGIALLVVGVILIVMGLNAQDSFASHLSKFFTGSPTDRTVWLMIGGVVALIVGAGAAFLPPKALQR